MLNMKLKKVYISHMSNLGIKILICGHKEGHKGTLNLNGIVTLGMGVITLGNKLHLLYLASPKYLKR